MHSDRSQHCVLALFAAFALGAPSGCNTLVGIEEAVLDSPPCAPSDTDCRSAREAGNVPCPDCTLGCLPPWQLEDPATGHCYLLEQFDKEPWASASHACIKIGSTLAALTSAEELHLISPLLRGATWIGGSDLAVRDSYAWSNGEPWSPDAPWVSGLPDSEGDKHCVVLSPEPPFAFDNARCSSRFGYLCERP
jgi:hypothetical protein